MNEAIYKQPLALFLGAGASKSLRLKTTPEFWDWFKYNYSSDLGTVGADLFVLAIEDAIKPSEEIGRKPDIEAVLDILQQITKGWDLGNEVFKNFHKGTFDLPHEYIEIQEKIKDVVVEHYSEVKKGEAFELYRPLLELAMHQPLPMFTTNYDLAIEKAFEFTISPRYELGKAPFNLRDGFSRARIVTPEWSRSAYEDYSPTGADVILFKLHGSVDWVRTPSGAIQRVESRKRDPGGMPTIIAYPSRLKSEIHEEPFRTNYDYLIACLLHTRLCAVIGFSFRDQEIVEEFRQAMELNKKLKLMIIDPNAKAIKSHLENKFGFEPKAELVIKEFTRENAQSIADQIKQGTYWTRIGKANLSEDKR